jgi:hypothetical protein
MKSIKDNLFGIKYSKCDIYTNYHFSAPNKTVVEIYIINNYSKYFNKFVGVFGIFPSFEPIGIKLRDSMKNINSWPFLT